jgi:hypothetical protein
MRKNRKQQKNKTSQQMELFDWYMEKPAKTRTSGTGERVITGVEMLSL